MEDGTCITWQEIENCITTAPEREVGYGKYGRIYKGVTANGEEFIVETLYPFSYMGNDRPGSTTEINQFHAEVRNQYYYLFHQHPNLVRLIMSEPGEAQHFCYEYLQNATSLQQYISDKSKELDWQTCYGIIKGTCDGLAYLHAGLEEPMYHLDLSPRWIMLDKNMVPKLHYVGFSKFLYQISRLDRADGPVHGTPGYTPPEYEQGKTVSRKFDVFSLGVVMINILTGELLAPGRYKEICDMPPDKIIDLTSQAQKNWRKILQDKFCGVSLELYCQQVTKCTEIALSCLERDMYKRPNIVEIFKRLPETDKFIEHKKIDPRDKILQRLQESRGDGISMELNILERGKEPSKLKLPLLELITDNFSEELKVGSGGYGAVYKGILRNGTVAVKKLFNTHTIDDQMFYQEVKSMMMVRHQNIVRLLGYCSHTEEQAMEKSGKIIMAEIRERLLCFEYISNGSLEGRITDELRGLEWNTRYEIIKGICDGLHHLHAEKRIIHMDLKPANILLDDSMVPKIIDFGLARLDEKTKTMSAERILTMGYCAPEYLHQGKMSAKSDIYSLGVIIQEIVIGSREKASIGKVLKRWKHRWNKSGADTLLAYKQVDKCLDLAQRCMHDDPTDRPNIWDIVGDLMKIDSTVEAISNATEYLKLEDMLRIEPLETHLTFELNKQMSCSIELTNNTDRYFAFRISTTSLRSYHIHPTKDIVPPRSKRSVTITLQALENASPHNHHKDEFSVQSTTVDGSLTTTDISGGMFNEKSGNMVDNVNLTVVLGI